MRGQLLLLILLFSFSAFGQTKKETIDWLNSKFESSPIASSEFEQYTRFLKINNDGSFSIQNYNYSPKVLLPNLENYRWKSLFTGHFKNLSPNSIRTEKIKGNLYIYATCSSGKCITQQNQGPDNFNSYTTSEVLLAFTSDTSLEARVKKAFTHLIKLCGGKSEAF